jgi:hypothetical protein
MDCPDTQQQGSATYGSSQSQQSSSSQRSSESGSATSGTSTSGTGTGGTGQSGTTATTPQQETNIIAVEPVEEKEEKSKSNARGVTVLLGGGVEGYTGAFAPRINPGPTWGVGVALKPTGALGLELGYSGAVNSVEGSSGLTSTGGTVAISANKEADLVRNGGSAVATIGLAPAQFQPYLLGGIGIDRYHVRNPSATTADFRDDNVGNVPLGLGFRSQIGSFTADLRGIYGVLFNQGFDTTQQNTHLGDIGSKTPDGRFQTQLRLGATF